MCVCDRETNLSIPVSAKASAAKLERSFKNGPKSAHAAKPCGGICHLCCAGKPGLDFEDLHLSFQISAFSRVIVNIQQK